MILVTTQRWYLINVVFQFRVILAAGLGLWWLIEIPALSKSSLGVVQHINGTKTNFSIGIRCVVLIIKFVFESKFH